MSKNIDETLQERGEVYGDYEGGSQLRASIMEIITDRHLLVTGKEMDKLHQIYIFDIVNKLSRLSTTPNHLDTWHDIAGYATIAEIALTPIENIAELKREMEKD